MNDYDLIAPFYDIEHAHFDEDLDMYRNFAELCTGPLLELACGSGGLLIPLPGEGGTLLGAVTATKMLSLAQERREEAGVSSKVTLVQQDMSALRLTQRFCLALVALGSKAHLTTRKT